jgi:hypothetical protein
MRVDQLALNAAAVAGKLAGIACEALVELVYGPPETPTQPDDFDEATAEKYLQGGAQDCGLGDSIPVCRHPGEHVLPTSAAAYSLDELYKLKARIDGDRWGEPELTGSELVAVRQLIEERFPLPSPAAVQPPAVVQETCPAPLLSPEAGGAGHPPFSTQ